MKRDGIRKTSPGFWAAGVLTTAALMAVGCGGGSGDDGGGGTAASASVARGQTLYQRTCASCHGADGRGMPGLGKDLHDNAFTKSLSDDEMLRFLEKGRPAWDEANTQGIDMPPKGGNPALTAEDLRNIIAFQRTLAQR